MASIQEAHPEKGLTKGTTYTFAVTATNCAFNGPAAVSNPVTPTWY